MTRRNLGNTLRCNQGTRHVLPWGWSNEGYRVHTHTNTFVPYPRDLRAEFQAKWFQRIQLDENRIYVYANVASIACFARRKISEHKWSWRSWWPFKSVNLPLFTTPDNTFDSVMKFAFDIDNVYISEQNTHRITLLNKVTGHFVKRWGVEGRANGQLYCPTTITLVNDDLYVMDSFRIQLFTKDGGFQGVVCGGAERSKKHGFFACPKGMCIVQNRLYVIEADNHRMQIFTPRFNHRIL